MDIGYEVGTVEAVMVPFMLAVMLWLFLQHPNRDKVQDTLSELPPTWHHFDDIREKSGLHFRVVRRVVLYFVRKGVLEYRWNIAWEGVNLEKLGVHNEPPTKKTAHLFRFRLKR